MDNEHVVTIIPEDRQPVTVTLSTFRDIPYSEIDCGVQSIPGNTQAVWERYMRKRNIEVEMPCLPREARLISNGMACPCPGPYYYLPTRGLTVCCHLLDIGD